MREIQRRIQVLRPRKMRLRLVVELRNQVRVTHLIRVGVRIRPERVQHEVIRPLDTPTVTQTHAHRLPYLAQRIAAVAHKCRREKVEIRLLGHRVRRHPVAMAERVLATQPQLGGPMRVELLARRDVSRTDMLAVEELRQRRTQVTSVQNRVRRHVVVRGRKRILAAALQQARLPELGLKIHLAAVDVHGLMTQDVQPNGARFVVCRLDITRAGRVAVVVDIRRNLTLQRLRKHVRKVQICSVLRRTHTRLRCRRAAARRVRALNHIRVVPTLHDVLMHVHVRHLQDESERVHRIDVPVIAHLHHVVLKIKPVARPRVDACRRCRLAGRYRARRFQAHVVLGKHLRQLTESVRLLAPIVQVQRHHIRLEVTVHVAVIHSAVIGRKHPVQSAHHVTLHLDVDDSPRTARIVLGRRVADDFNLLNHVTVGAVQHRFQLVAAQVRRPAVNPDLHRLAVDRDVTVFVDTHTRSATQDVVAVTARSQWRLTHVHHQFVHVLLDERTFGFHFHLTQPLCLFPEHKIRPAECRLITHKRCLHDIRARVNR